MQFVIIFVGLLAYVKCFFPFDVVVSENERRPSVNAHEALFQPSFGSSDDDEDEKVNYTQIREDSRVAPFVGNITSYAGLLMINEFQRARLFYWFFESERNPTTDPLLLWLQGELGYSSLFGLFGENGPYQLVAGNITSRNTSWTKYYNVLYIDNPIGAGYSYTRYKEAHPRTVQQAADQLYTGLQLFFKIYPEFRNNAFYLTGESYCGKYMPALATLIHAKNLGTNSTEEKINLAGLFIGSPFVDPYHQLYFADYFYEMGIVDPKERDLVMKHETDARRHIRMRNYFDAHFNLFLVGAVIGKKGYSIDVMEPWRDFSDVQGLEAFIQRDDFKRKLRINHVKYQDKGNAARYFQKDMWNSVGLELSKLIHYNYPILLYVGQYDATVPHTQLDRLLDSMGWDGKEEFVAKKPKRWYVDGELAGIKWSHKNFTKVLVRKANHIINNSQPNWMLKLLRSFT